MGDITWISAWLKDKKMVFTRTVSFSYIYTMSFLWGSFNSIPNDKFFDWSKFKALADDKVNVTEKLKFVLGR